MARGWRGRHRRPGDDCRTGADRARGRRPADHLRVEARMKILAFDTATRATTVALSGDGDTCLEGRDDPVPGERPGHVSRLLPLIAEVMERGGLGFADLDRIAVGVGPGTFTG